MILKMSNKELSRLCLVCNVSIALDRKIHCSLCDSAAETLRKRITTEIQDYERKFCSHFRRTDEIWAQTNTGEVFIGFMDPTDMDASSTQRNVPSDVADIPMRQDAGSFLAYQPNDIQKLIDNSLDKSQEMVNDIINEEEIPPTVRTPYSR